MALAWHGFWWFHNGGSWILLFDVNSDTKGASIKLHLCSLLNSLFYNSRVFLLFARLRRHVLPKRLLLPAVQHLAPSLISRPPTSSRTLHLTARKLKPQTSHLLRRITATCLSSRVSDTLPSYNTNNYPASRNNFTPDIIILLIMDRALKSWDLDRIGKSLLWCTMILMNAIYHIHVPLAKRSIEKRGGGVRGVMHLFWDGVGIVVVWTVQLQASQCQLGISQTLREVHWTWSQVHWT